MKLFTKFFNKSAVKPQAKSPTSSLEVEISFARRRITPLEKMLLYEELQKKKSPR